MKLVRMSVFLSKNCGDCFAPNMTFGLTCALVELRLLLLMYSDLSAAKSNLRKRRMMAELMLLDLMKAGEFSAFK